MYIPFLTRHNFYTKLKLAFLFGLLPIILPAQSNYKFTIYTQENGLASSTVTGIAKDSAGFIWLFSENGLSRFDGYDFKTFRSDANNSQSISSPYLFGMVQDSAGNILFQTSNGIAKY
jgi:ligand-binding sensor domain-containing protein